jgi:hypothetical protein
MGAIDRTGTALSNQVFQEFLQPEVAETGRKT